MEWGSDGRKYGVGEYYRGMEILEGWGNTGATGRMGRKGKKDNRRGMEIIMLPFHLHWHRTL